MNVLDDIRKTAIKLLIQESFYGHFFTHIDRIISAEVSRVSISITENKNIVLLVNSDYWKSLQSDEQKIGCLKHQIMHLILKHIFRLKFFGNKDIFHIAADVVVNQYLVPEQLTPDAICLHDFPSIDFLPNQTVDYYYHKLAQVYGEQELSVTKRVSEEDNKDIVVEKNPLDEHQKWYQLSDLEGATKQYIQNTIDVCLENSARRINTQEFGLLPAELQILLTEVLQRFQPSVNWKRMLKLFLGSSKKTFVHNTLKRPSKRYGTTPGIKIRSKQKILIALDTSGSIEKNDLEVFFNEVYHIWKQLCDIMIVECDTVIQKEYLYKGKMPKLSNGRGGTCFNEPIKFANEKYKPDVLIYFTDGFGPKPIYKSRCPILWLITSNGIAKENWGFLVGRKIKIAFV